MVGGFVKMAVADSYHYSPYVGADYAYSRTNAKGFEPYHNAAVVRIGSDYSKYFGTEVFFGQSESNKRRPNGENIKTSYRAYGLDLIAYLPLGCEKNFSLLATTGIGEYLTISPRASAHVLFKTATLTISQPSLYSCSICFKVDFVSSVFVFVID